MEKTNILIVEDQSMPKQLFEIFVKSVDSYNLVASTDNGTKAIEYTSMYSIDLIIMDVILSGKLNGLETAEIIKKSSPNIKIIIVTSMPECSYIDKARKIGIDSFWYKEISKEPILAVIERTINGESIYPDSTPLIAIGCAKSTEFTEREIDVLRELTAGMTNEEISQKLFLSINTVKKYIQNLIDKTGLKNRTDLAVEALKTGMIIPPKNEN